MNVHAAFCAGFDVISVAIHGVMVCDHHVVTRESDRTRQLMTLRASMWSLVIRLQPRTSSSLMRRL